MAGEWLKFDASTPEKPEVLAITVAMGWDDPDMTVGKLLRVWRWFDQQTVNGNAPGVTPALLDRLLGVTGLCAAMAKVRWLIVTEDGLTLPNFERHNGKTAKDRALTAKRVANYKNKSAEGNDGGNAASVTPALPREEKRREEEEIHSSAKPTGTPSIPCPYQAIVDRYHARLPMLPKVKLMNAARQRALRKTWGWVLSSTKSDGQRRATTADEALAWLDGYFAKAAENDWLTGRSRGTGEHANWQCDIDFLLTEKGMKHVIEKTQEAAA